MIAFSKMVMQLALAVWLVPIVFITTVQAQAVPEFRLPVLGSQGSLGLADFKGKVLYVDFWASWCLPCAESIPAMEKIRNQLHSQGFEVIAINLDESVDDAKRFLLSKPVSYPVLLDRKQKTPAQFGIQGMPTAYLLDRQGQVRLTHVGFRKGDGEKLKIEIEKLLQE
jgi:thiol-disulfide isomerase/thioredoxin